MERKDHNLREQFCKDIIRQAESCYFFWHSKFKTQFKNSHKTEQQGFIDVRLHETRKDVEQSDYSMWFPLDTPAMDFTAGLEKYFRTTFISQVQGVEYRKSIGRGNYEYHSRTRKMTIQPTTLPESREVGFSFASLNDFQPLVKFLVLKKMLVKLGEQSDKMKRKNQVSQPQPPPVSIGQIEEAVSEPPVSANKIPDTKMFLQIFKGNSYDLFCYLEGEYTKDNQWLKAKYSHLFHFLKEKQLIFCTREEYKKFIKNEREVSMSKIFDQTYKYTETILPLLDQLKKGFEG